MNKNDLHDPKCKIKGDPVVNLSSARAFGYFYSGFIIIIPLDALRRHPISFVFVLFVSSCSNLRTKWELNSLITTSFAVPINCCLLSFGVYLRDKCLKLKLSLQGCFLKSASSFLKTYNVDMFLYFHRIAKEHNFTVIKNIK